MAQRLLTFSFLDKEVLSRSLLLIKWCGLATMKVLLQTSSSCFSVKLELRGFWEGWNGLRDWTLHNGKVGGHVSTFLKIKVEVRQVSNKWEKVRYLGLFSHESDSTFTNVRSFVCQSQKPLSSLKSSSFIIHPSTFIILHSFFLHFATFKLFSLFLSQKWS